MKLPPTIVLLLQPLFSDSNHCSLIATTVLWFQPLSPDSSHCSLIPTIVLWFQPLIPAMFVTQSKVGQCDRQNLQNTSWCPFTDDVDISCNRTNQTAFVGTLDSDSDHLAAHWSTQQNMAAKLKACGNVTMGNGAARLMTRSDDYMVIHVSKQMAICCAVCWCSSLTKWRRG